ncbi:GFA family protein [Microbulbifer sp. THAF38]|uniref:GFA family protein n=1 Tax=Microbulbifer sp. THAF38 TaxID=2587856 RepID=UPI0012695746|nr:GFA family protein [Microbulbifer sp. THAF38]QFT56217.1 Glutathione-dependent formaldehyde-activating enzyme [Microbulbifer sp. THAF38]
MNHKGSCLCDEVHFEVEGEFESFFLCHCDHCRKDTGSAHAANLFSSSAKLQWLSGEEYIRVFRLPSTRHVKSFCSQCGSALPYADKETGLVAVPAGSLNSPITIKPTGHIFMGSKADWDKDLSKAPKFGSFPQEDNVDIS